MFSTETGKRCGPDILARAADNARKDAIELQDRYQGMTQIRPGLNLFMSAWCANLLFLLEKVKWVTKL